MKNYLKLFIFCLCQKSIQGLLPLAIASLILVGIPSSIHAGLEASKPTAQYSLAGNTPPVVNITFPPDGSTVSGTIPFSASVIDDVGVTLVDFYVHSSLIASISIPPYSRVIDTHIFPDGPTQFTAIAYDAAGNSSQNTVNIRVQNGPFDPIPPVVNITFPPDGSTVSGTLPFSANATDNVGVTHVDLYIHSSLIASISIPPYTKGIDTRIFPDGPTQFTAIAYDAAGNTAQSTINITVQNGPYDPIPPVVNITFPPDGSTVSGTIPFSATATDNVGVTHVDFYIDSFLIASISIPPYTRGIDTHILPDGHTQFTAIAYDAAGNSAQSTVNITVQNQPVDPIPPVVNITFPPDGSTVSGTIPFSANATDNVGVTHVDFYIDSFLIASISIPPYSKGFDTRIFPNGHNQFTAIAYDAAGNSAQSTVNITVQN